MFRAIINTPGYLPWADENHEFETCSQAWEYLRDQRLYHLDDPMADEDADSPDEPIEEMESYIDTDEVGSVWGHTPGYDGDHDLGIKYSVAQVTYASEVRPPNSLIEWESVANLPVGAL